MPKPEPNTLIVVEARRYGYTDKDGVDHELTAGEWFKRFECNIRVGKVPGWTVTDDKPDA